MKNYCFAPYDCKTLKIVGSTELFPVNRIFCVGRNYAGHAREMGSDPSKEPPFFFMKAATALVAIGNEVAVIPYPPMTNNLHHEIELVVAIGSDGFEINQVDASKFIYGYAVGLDMTRRDLQLAAVEKGRPWEFGKAFSFSAPIGPISPVAQIGYLTEAAVSLKVNDSLRQSSNINQLIWSVPEIISYLSRYEPLLRGDLIMTGTPEGIGPVVIGDILHGKIEGIGEITAKIGA